MFIFLNCCLNILKGEKRNKFVVSFYYCRGGYFFLDVWKFDIVFCGGWEIFV